MQAYGLSLPSVACPTVRIGNSCYTSGSCIGQARLATPLRKACSPSLRRATDGDGLVLVVPVLVLFVTWALLTWYQSRRSQAQAAGIRVWKLYQKVEEGRKQAVPKEQLSRLSEDLQQAKVSFAKARKLDAGPLGSVELLPEVRQMAGESRHHPSALRNRQPILQELQRLLDDAEGYALEVASNSGAHLEIFVPAFPRLEWQPSDYYELRSPQLQQLDETLAEVASGNVHPALSLDLTEPFESWPSSVQKQEKSVRLVYASNITHCTAWGVTCGLFSGASKLLQSDGDLIIYGPFKESGKFSSEGNQRFDASLREQNPAWGYRDINEMVAEAEKCGLALVEIVPMPANNLLLQFKPDSADAKRRRNEVSQQ